MQSLPHILGGGIPPPMSAGPEDSSRRACDQCRMRKVRCDKDWPCSNCRTAKRNCTSTGAGQRPKEARQRVLISSQYERKIDQIESRLGSIEGLLRNIALGNSTNNDSTQRSSHTPGTGPSEPNTTTGSTVDYDSSDDESVIGGDSGFTSQTAFASEFLEHAVERTSLRGVNPGIDHALTSLRQLVKVQEKKSLSHGPRFPLQKPLPPGGLAKLAMPPMDVVIPLLKKHKVGPPSMFTLASHLVGVPDLSPLCRVVYFPDDDFSPATFAIVNSGLYNLFLEEASLEEDDAQRAEYETYGHLAEANVETYLANLPFNMSAKLENVQALLFGVQYCIDVSRPSLAWDLTCVAFQLCQTGGYHRAESTRNDPHNVRQVKRNLFWQVYTWNKGLSLRLGRASVIQDCDIDIPRNFDFQGWPHLEKSKVPELWVRTSSLQGRIYEQLYSPAALAGPPELLHQRAAALAHECRNLESDVNPEREETIAYLRSKNSSGVIDLLIKGDEVIFLTTLTLVFQAMPVPEGSPSRFCIECLDTARKAIKAHMNSMASLLHGSYMKSIYVHMNLMLTPFAPFFVLFCHIVETSSADDLQVLQEFVASMETLQDASTTVAKLCRVFQVYRDVAVVYVEAKSQQQEDQTMVPIGDEFDMYLSQLGFMSTDGQSMMQPQQPLAAQTMQPAAGAQTLQMADWFSGNRNMFGLLEEDLSQIDSGWMPQGPDMQ